MIYLVIILSIILIGVLAFFGLQKYNEIHDRIENQQQEIKDREAALIVSEEKFKEKENLLNQEKEIFDLEKKVFLKSQAAKFDLTDKNEKEIAIELYSRFIQMESEFARYQRALNSLDSKVANIKDYSEQMETMSKELCDQFGLYKDNLVTTNSAYVEKLNDLQKDVNRIMDTILTELDDTIQESTTRTFGNLNNQINSLLGNTAGDISNRVIASLPKSIDKYDIQMAVREAIESSMSQRTIPQPVQEPTFAEPLPAFVDKEIKFEEEDDDFDDDFDTPSVVKPIETIIAENTGESEDIADEDVVEEGEDPILKMLA